MADPPRLTTESIAGQRPYQEDAVLAQELPDGRTLVAVADGMGGHAAGEVASALALETLVEALTQGESLSRAFVLANERVNAKSSEPGKQGMGTTLVAMVLDGDSFEVANVGDSRLYTITRDAIEQRTEDHSFVAEASKRGEVSPELAQRYKDALTRSIGTSPEVKVDAFGPFPVERNTAVVLCSDGLYKSMPDGEILGVFLRSGGPKGAAQSLVAEALEAGSDDNISVAIVEFGQVPRERAAGTVPIEFEPPPEPEAEPEASPAMAGGGSAPEPETDDEVGVPASVTSSSHVVPLGLILTIGALIVIVVLAVALLGD